MKLINYSHKICRAKNRTLPLNFYSQHHALNLEGYLSEKFGLYNMKLWEEVIDPILTKLGWHKISR